MKVWTAGLLGLLIWGVASAQQPVPIAEEFQVNSYTTSDQWSPAVAVNPEGDFVVVWSSDGSYGTDTDSRSVQGQRYDDAGSPIDQQFQVNTITDGWQSRPDIAIAPDGRFVVVWHDYFDYQGDAIEAQLYDSDGTKEGGEFTVHSTFYPTYLEGSKVEMDADGNFIVAWRDWDQFRVHTISNIKARLFEASGAPGRFVSVSHLSGNYASLFNPALDVGSGGDFVVVWKSGDRYRDPPDGIAAREYDAAGDPVTEEFWVTTYTTNVGRYPAVALDSAGGFLVVWSSDGSAGSDTDSESIQGRLFDSDGDPIAPQFQVNTYTTGEQVLPSVAALANGGFVVTWESSGSGGSDQDGSSVQGQALDSSGGFIGSQFQINTYATLDQGWPRVAVDDEGDFVVVWGSDGSYGTDSDSQSVQGQRFRGPHWIYSDGFESSDTSAWSSTVQ